MYDVFSDNYHFDTKTKVIDRPRFIEKRVANVKKPVGLAILLEHQRSSV